MMYLLTVLISLQACLIWKVRANLRAQNNILPSLEEASASFFSAYAKAKWDSQKYSARPIIYPPSAWLAALEQRYRSLDRLVTDPSAPKVSQRAIQAYADFLEGMVNGLNYGTSERTLYTQNRTIGPLNRDTREIGKDGAYLGVTMVGVKRLKNLFQLLQSLQQQAIPGAVVETGVWRGGASIYMEGVMTAMGMDRHKLLILADSFQGLPKGGNLHPGDMAWWTLSWYFGVHEDDVIQNFLEYHLLRPNVYCLKGYFNDSAPLFRRYLKQHGEKLTAVGYEPGIALLRMDGDMYQSTVDILYHLYDQVVRKGFIIIDDWYGFPAQDAVRDFFSVHQVKLPNVIHIDSSAVYWQKEEAFPIQYWRYEQKKFKN